MPNIQIYCPLSYGSYIKYKETVKQKGLELFGERFIPIERFMQFEEYKAFLETIDIAVFNHKRQEAMGVTLTLLSLGKEVYVNSSTASFQSFSQRGFQLFDNALIQTEKDSLATRNVAANGILLEKYYSKQVWETQWKQLYNLNSFDEFA
jgi:c-di-GMP-related signal transduction protein